jgi:hypothetical protein
MGDKCWRLHPLHVLAATQVPVRQRTIDCDVKKPTMCSTLRQGGVERKVSNCHFVRSGNAKGLLPFPGQDYSHCSGAFEIAKIDY